MSQFTKVDLCCSAVDSFLVALVNFLISDFFRFFFFFFFLFLEPHSRLPSSLSNIRFLASRTWYFIYHVYHFTCLKTVTIIFGMSGEGFGCFVLFCFVFGCFFSATLLTYGFGRTTFQVNKKTKKKKRKEKKKEKVRRKKERRRKKTNKQNKPDTEKSYKFESELKIKNQTINSSSVGTLHYTGFSLTFLILTTIDVLWI